MNDEINHIHRRGQAIDRLRSLTAGAAVAGLAGTVGFGALAAATWSGDPNAKSAAGVSNRSGGGSGLAAARGGWGDDNGANEGSDDRGSFFGTQPAGGFGTVPNAGDNQLPTFVRPAQPGSRGHATSGGSH